MSGSEAFGRPGIGPTWTSSAKDLVITALGPSRLWATLGHGIVNEVYWPATGMPQIRDLGFIVAGDGFWAEIKRENRYRLEMPEPYIPLPRVVHEGDRYRLTLEFLPDPTRDVLLISYRLEGEGLRLYPLLAPHLSVGGTNNTAWVQGDLYAQRDDRALCLASYPPFRRGSAGYVGFSDGWQDFARNASMTWEFRRAGHGNVALVGELAALAGVLALAFALTPEGAHTLAWSSLAEGYSHVRARYVEGWERWGKQLRLPESSPELEREAYLSAVVLRSHEDRTYPGAVVASLSIPWGTTGNDPGGYHLVWTRDAIMAALGLYAVGGVEDCRRVLAYLAARQDDDGRWCQNFYPDGRGYWAAVQLDEVGLPILLAATLREAGEHETAATVAMVRRAASYIARHGPLTAQDRWEENAGASPFTLAVEVAALVAAAPYLEGADRSYALELADSWNERIEEWTYASGTSLAAKHGVDGYYVRIAAPPASGGVRGKIPVRNTGGRTAAAHELVGLEFAYLARLGLRDANDRRIRDTVTVVEALTAAGTPAGVGFHRYNGDGYGEHEDGSPFAGRGTGRLWPLLVGERGHLALLQGEDPTPYLETMARMTGPCGLIPEQVWDREPIPERGLYPGKPTGGAMPLAWAHAEFLRLLVARARGAPFERLEVVWERYGGKAPAAAAWFWRDDVPFAVLPPGRSLVIEHVVPFVLHVGHDGWQSIEDIPSAPIGLGMHGVRFAPSDLRAVSQLHFTRFLPGEDRWEGTDHVISVGRAP